MNINVGDVIYHKATHNRCVIRSMDEGKLTVVDANGNVMSGCALEEFYSEAEWERK